MATTLKVTSSRAGVYPPPRQGRDKPGPYIRVTVAALCLSLLAGCSSEPPGEPPGPPPAEGPRWDAIPLSEIPELPEGGDYTVRMGDELEVRVYDQPDLSVTAPVRPDGKMSLPLVGDVLAAGRTVEDLKDEIASRLSKFVLEPQVSVIVHKFAGTRVLVLGEVKTPGAKSLPRNARVLDALAAAEGPRIAETGFGAFAGPDLSRAYLVRGGRVLGVDFRRLLEDADSTQNILVAEGDFIYLPSSFENEVFVLGEVKEPGPVRIQGTTSLMEAIAKAGGLEENVTTGSILLVRGSLTDPKTYCLSVDDILAGRARDVPLVRDDIVFVSSSTFDAVISVASKILPLLQNVIAARQAKAAINTIDQSDRVKD
ncbi:MAG: polysaccharide export protein [Planctomycetes bacterium]|nr:polysaccharide export protein [Planctomycetota bacterium]